MSTDKLSGLRVCLVASVAVAGVARHDPRQATPPWPSYCASSGRKADPTCSTRTSTDRPRFRREGGSPLPLPQQPARR